MRLLTYKHDGRLRLAALIGEQVVDLATMWAARTGETAPPDVRGLIEAGPALWARLAEALAAGDVASFARPLAGLELAAPIQNPSKVIAIGLNYWDHVREQGGEPPKRPLVFAKFPTAVTGPRDEIVWDPALTNKVDWEAELAVVIGRTARRVPAERAYDYVFGYTVANDVSARDLQFGDGQWVRGKSLDSFCPLGPWIVTRDEIPDPHALTIRCAVNDELVQDSTTAELIFGIPALIEFLSQAFTLLPGDVILTGTPDGVGHFRNPPRYLADGDLVTAEVGGIGALSNRCRVETRTSGSA